VRDGLGAYNAWTGMTASRTRHIVVSSFRSWPNNDRMERLNGSVGDWLRRKGLHRMESAWDLLLGWTVHHDYVHRHSRLDVTPAEAMGLRLPLERDAWRNLIGLMRKLHPDYVTPPLGRKLFTVSLSLVRRREREDLADHSAECGTEEEHGPSAMGHKTEARD